MLIGLYWTYDEPGQPPLGTKRRWFQKEHERIALIDNVAQREARAWLQRHP